MEEHATYSQAVEIWKTEGKVSARLLQRRLGIGYGRAPRPKNYSKPNMTRPRRPLSEVYDE